MTCLSCDIVTPTHRLLSDEFHLIVVPGIEGEMGFLHGHAPLVSVLADGTARLHKDEDDIQRVLVLQGGYVEVTGEKVIILADHAAFLENIRVDEVQAEREETLQQLENLEENSAAYTTLQDALRWCDVRLKAVF